jgi:hypothetical protein
VSKEDEIDKTKLEIVRSVLVDAEKKLHGDIESTVRHRKRPDAVSLFIRISLLKNTIASLVFNLNKFLDSIGSSLSSDDQLKARFIFGLIDVFEKQYDAIVEDFELRILEKQGEAERLGLLLEEQNDITANMRNLIEMLSGCEQITAHLIKYFL